MRLAFARSMRSRSLARVALRLQSLRGFRLIGQAWLFQEAFGLIQC